MYHDAMLPLSLPLAFSSVTRSLRNASAFAGILPGITAMLAGCSEASSAGAGTPVESSVTPTGAVPSGSESDSAAGGTSPSGSNDPSPLPLTSTDPAAPSSGGQGGTESTNSGGVPVSGGAPGSGGTTPGSSGADPGGGGTGPVGGNTSLAGSAGSGGSARGGEAGANPTNGGSAGMAGGGLGGSEANPPPFDDTFWLGADISSVQEAIDSGATYIDTDGQTKSILELLAAHGFNAIRLRTFVEPGAEYGYASCGQGDVYCDTEHNVEFGRQVKEAGMRLLLDFHYSDTWADPGKQVIPEAWRDVTSIEELATLVHDYTEDAVQRMIDGGARPDLVQVGNEITPGMLIHVPTSNTDCYGNNSEVNPTGITGQASQGNWDNLATLLRAGIDGVKAADPTIAIMLHIENTESAQGVNSWVESAKSRGVEFDVLGLSCYTAFQGEPSVWRNTFEAVAEANPDLKFVVAEYNPERTEANLMMHDLPNEQGLGTFFWEPTQSGSWGESMFSRQGNTYTASDDFAEYDALRSELGL